MCNLTQFDLSIDLYANNVYLHLLAAVLLLCCSDKITKVLINKFLAGKHVE